MTRRRQPLPLGDGSERDAAGMLALTIEAFREKLPRLLSRGFPGPDPDTERFDLDAIKEWRRRRYPRLFPTLSSADGTPLATALEGPDAKATVRRRLAAMNG